MLIDFEFVRQNKEAGKIIKKSLKVCINIFKDL